MGLPAHLDTKEEMLGTSFMTTMGFNGVVPDDSIDGGVLGPGSAIEGGVLSSSSTMTPSPQRLSICRTGSGVSSGSFRSSMSGSSISGYSWTQSSPMVHLTSPSTPWHPSHFVEVLWRGKMRTKDSGWFTGGSMWLPAELRGVKRKNDISYAQVMIQGCARGALETVPLSMVRQQSRSAHPSAIGEYTEGAEIIGGLTVWYCGILQAAGDRLELCISGADDGKESVSMYYPMNTSSSRLRAAPQSTMLTYDEACALLSMTPPSVEIGFGAENFEKTSAIERANSAETMRLHGDGTEDELWGMEYPDDEWISSWHAQASEQSHLDEWGLQGELYSLSELLCPREAADISSFARNGGFDQTYKGLVHETSGGWAQCSAAKAEDLVEVCLEALEVADAAVRMQASRFLLVCAMGLPRRNAPACASIRKLLGRPNVYYSLVKALAVSTSGYASVVEPHGDVGDGGPNGQQKHTDPDVGVMRRKEAAAHSNLLYVVIGLLKSEMCPHNARTGEFTPSYKGSPKRTDPEHVIDKNHFGPPYSRHTYEKMRELSNIVVSRGEQDSITLPELLVELLSHAGAGPSRYPVPFKKFVCLLHRILLVALPPPQSHSSNMPQPPKSEQNILVVAESRSSSLDDDFVRLPSNEFGLSDRPCFPKCHVEEACAYAARIKAAYENRVPRSLHEGNNLVMSRVRMWSGMRKPVVSQTTPVDIFDLQEMDQPPDCSAATLYSLLLLKLPALVVSLLKLLLAAGVNAKETTSPPVDDLYFDVGFEAEFMQGHEANVAWERHRRIVTSHAPACLLLMMKRWRHCHYLQAEYLARLVSDSNFLLLALKYLNQDCCQVLNQAPGVHEMDSEILALIDGRSRFKHSVPPPREPGPEQEASQERDSGEADADKSQSPAEKGHSPLDEGWQSVTRCRRSTTCMMAVMRMLQRVVKYSGVRIRTLVNLKAPLILRKPALLPNKILEKYSLKLFKSIGPFLGRKWKQNNGRILSRIFHTFPPDLHRDYLEPDTGTAEEDLNRDKRMRAATDEFNYRFYLMTSRSMPEMETPKDRVARLLASLTVMVKGSVNGEDPDGGFSDGSAPSAFTPVNNM